jgi:hypothetical protein
MTTKENRTGLTASNLHPEALELAKRVQKEGQSKEEIKRIAQGISKGIELYKKQQSAKQRERDKLQKRLKKQKDLEREQSEINQIDEAIQGFSLKLALLVSGIVFLTISIGLILSTLMSWKLIIGPIPLPNEFEWVLAIILGGLSAANLYQAYTIQQN